MYNKNFTTKIGQYYVTTAKQFDFIRKFQKPNDDMACTPGLKSSTYMMIPVILFNLLQVSYVFLIINVRYPYNTF